MLMPNRHGQSDDYRYGFNGMEMDDEVRNTKGASYDFGARMLDPRIGRWLSGDPLENLYPSISTYTFVANSPLLFIDPDGKKLVIAGDPETVKLISYHLALLYSTKEGQLMLDKIIASPKTFTIQHSTTIADSYERNIKTTFYDANAATIISDDEYTGDQSPVITLGHEVSHMYIHLGREEAGDFDFSDDTYEKLASSQGNYFRAVFGFKNMRKYYNRTWPTADLEISKNHGNELYTGEKVTNISPTNHTLFESLKKEKSISVSIDFEKTEDIKDVRW